MSPTVLVLVVALTILVSVLFDVAFFALYIYLTLPASLRVHAPLLDGPKENPEKRRDFRHSLLILAILFVAGSLLVWLIALALVGVFK